MNCYRRHFAVSSRKIGRPESLLKGVQTSGGVAGHDSSEVNLLAPCRQLQKQKRRVTSSAVVILDIVLQ